MPPTLWRIVTKAALLICIGYLSPVHAQDGRDVLDYMVENRVAFATASSHLELNFIDTAESIGYSGVFGALEAQLETSYLLANCWTAYFSVRGTAEAIGLTTSAVEQYFDLRMANDMSFLQRCRDADDDSSLSFNITVWTVGNDYPVARYTRIRANIWPDYEGRPMNFIDDEWLGYASAAATMGAVRETIQGAVEDYALTYLKVRALR